MTATIAVAPAPAALRPRSATLGVAVAQFACLCVHASASELTGVFVAGSPPDYVANCTAGSKAFLLNVPGIGPNVSLECDSDGCDTGGPRLSVHGAGELGVDGVFEYRPDNASQQHYTRGRLTILWEPGPRDVYGLRWVLYGPAGLLYYKYSPDWFIGWRVSNSTGEWSARVGVNPPPILAGARPTEALTVLSAGDTAVLGTYTRVFGTDDIVFRRDPYWIAWEPGPQVSTGHRWVVFNANDPSGKVTQTRPYYYRLSNDSSFGYQGVWVADRGMYPPPRVGLVQSVACVRCPEGYFSSKHGASSCERCPAGFYSLGGAGQCTACLPGRFADGTVELVSRRMEPTCDAEYLAASRGSCTVPLPGAKGCLLCEPGRFSLAGAGSCAPCPGGHIAPFAGATVCAACTAGTWSAPGATVCERCSAGRAMSSTVSHAASPLQCEFCPPGRYAALNGATICSECLAGKFAHSQGLSECRPCPQGSYAADAGSSTCTICVNTLAGPGAAVCQL